VPLRCACAPEAVSAQAPHLQAASPPQHQACTRSVPWGLPGLREGNDAAVGSAAGNPAAPPTQPSAEGEGRSSQTGVNAYPYRESETP